ncbi:hypothetical protein Slin15195_G071940 [Septoria linicola]|uniref:DUF4470 domain-containing protein n=1 Tax=Septoria linicola TaxID=215465 RepID=A0A9Q9AWM0_9PEZI|nr:hypothetical protein Slin15195_G071940 [Septoria linicola]
MAKNSYAPSTMLNTYCSRACQYAHKAEHDQYCRSPLLNSAWEPQWVLQDRIPEFLASGAYQATGDGLKHFWSKAPAYDIVKLANNEGVACDDQLSVLVAISGDLGKVVRTVTSLPSSYEEDLWTTINDPDFEIVARNVLILLIALRVPNHEAAVTCMIHLWYSAYIRKQDADLLRQYVQPLIRDLLHKISPHAPHQNVKKTWIFGSVQLSVGLTKDNWQQLLQLCETPQEVDKETARVARQSVTLAPHRVDYRELRMLSQDPAHRVCEERFRKDGILLPFGHPRAGFDIPNPTFFQCSFWPMTDSTLPIDGYSREEVLAAGSSAVKNDLFGKLYIHLYGLFTKFRQRAKAFRLTFQMFNVAVDDLPVVLAEQHYDRIDASNVSESSYLSVKDTVSLLAPLLWLPPVNKHATLITFHLDAVIDRIRDYPDVEVEKAARSLAMLMVKLKLTGSSLQATCPSASVLVIRAQDYVRDVDKYFDAHKVIEDFRKVERLTSMRIKQQHTVIEEWPTRLKLKYWQPGAQQEFDQAFGGAHKGMERYLEWKKAQ